MEWGINILKRKLTKLEAKHNSVLRLHVDVGGG